MGADKVVHLLLAYSDDIHAFTNNLSLLNLRNLSSESNRPATNRAGRSLRLQPDQKRDPERNGLGPDRRESKRAARQRTGQILVLDGTRTRSYKTFCVA